VHVGGRGRAKAVPTVASPLTGWGGTRATLRRQQMGHDPHGLRNSNNQNWQKPTDPEEGAELSEGVRRGLLARRSSGPPGARLNHRNAARFEGAIPTKSRCVFPVRDVGFDGEGGARSSPLPREPRHFRGFSKFAGHFLIHRSASIASRKSIHSVRRGHRHQGMLFFFFPGGKGRGCAKGTDGRSSNPSGFGSRARATFGRSSFRVVLFTLGGRCFRPVRGRREAGLHPGRELPTSTIGAVKGRCSANRDRARRAGRYNATARPGEALVASRGFAQLP